MINSHDFYTILSAMTPLYVAMILAYGSVRWWNIFTPDQCSGINRFVAVFAVPLLSFHFISTNNPYTMDLRFIAADTLQKIIMLVVLIVWANFSKHGSLDWLITIFSISTLPNTLVMGIPLLVAMYGAYCKSLMVQIVVLQCIIWYTLLIFLFEYRGAKILIMEQVPQKAGSIVSFKVDPDVVSLDANDCLETDTTILSDGKLHVNVRKSNASRSRTSVGIGQGLPDVCPRLSNFSDAEIYSMNTDNTPRGSGFDPADFYTMTEAQNYLKSSSQRASNLGKPQTLQMQQSKSTPKDISFRGSNEAPVTNSKSQQDDLNRKEVRLLVSGSVPKSETEGGGNTELEKASDTGKEMPPTSVMTRLIMVMVWRKLIRNPNTYSSILGLIWSLIHFRWNIPMPTIVDKSIAILSDAGLGMAMFTLGLFMALQPSLIPCGKARATYAMAVRFITGPAVMAAASLILGIRGELLQVAIVQAALPQAIVPFVFAKEYDVHAQILSTAVIFGMLIALPITLIYYILLGL